MIFENSWSSIKKVYDLAWYRLQKNIVMDDDKMIDGRTGEELGPEVDLTYARNQF